MFYHSSGRRGAEQTLLGAARSRAARGGAALLGPTTRRSSGRRGEEQNCSVPWQRLGAGQLRCVRVGDELLDLQHGNHRGPAFLFSDNISMNDSEV